MQQIGQLLPFVAVALLFWLLIIRPASRRQKAQAQMQRALSVGDEVILTSGIHGTVAELADDVAHVTIAEGVTVRVARAAVGSVVPTRDEPLAEAPDSGNEDSQDSLARREHEES